jgi:DNA-binding PadR family transcriptional regulator
MFRGSSAKRDTAAGETAVTCGVTPGADSLSMTLGPYLPVMRRVNLSAGPQRTHGGDGIVRQPLLALLAKEPAHGYELKLALEQTFGQAYPSPNIGQIYVTLKRLEQDGLVRSEDVEQTTRPNKRVYELTPAGREALRAWVNEPSDGPRVRDEFFIKLILAPMAGLADRMELMNTQRRHYLGIMRNLTELQADADPADVPARLLIEGAILHLQADLDWLERCQEELV